MPALYIYIPSLITFIQGSPNQEPQLRHLPSLPYQEILIKTLFSTLTQCFSTPISSSSTLLEPLVTKNGKSGLFRTL